MVTLPTAQRLSECVIRVFAQSQSQAAKVLKYLLQVSQHIDPAVKDTLPLC